MPNARSFCRVALLWLLRAWAFLCCAQAISFAACSYSGLEARPSSHQDLTTAAAATWTWQTVTSGFFPPKLLADSGQEQIAHGRERQMSLQSHPAAALVVVQTHFPLLIFETPLDPPTGKGHPQERAKPRVGGSVAEEVLDLVVIEHVAGNDQVVWLVGKALFVLRVNQRMLSFPHHRAFLPILHSPVL